MHYITQLPNGVRVTTAPMPQMESVVVGIWIGVGGRYEPKRVAGISHFIEHLLFEGTARRTSKQISQTVEGIVARLAKVLPLPCAMRVPGFESARSKQRGAQLRFLTKTVEQTHLAIGIRGFSSHDDRRYSMKLRSVLMGENMSSRLFQTIREKHGLAYSIQTGTSYFADAGVFLISAGLDSKRLHKALRLVLVELKKIAQRPPSAGELRRAKDYAIGQMRLGLESTGNQMTWIGEHLLAYNRIHSPDEIERRMEAVTADDVATVATELFDDNRLNAAVITPGKDEAAVKELLTFG